MHRFSNPFRLILPLVLLFLGASCSNYQKIIKSNDNEFKLQKAIEYYEDEDYNKAIGLLTDVIPVFRGTQKAEQVNYYYAMAHYKMGDYTLASHYLKSFVTGFPGSKHAEEFLFLSAYSKYLESPRPSLDQTPTREAIAELQSFVNRFPKSERVADANDLIDELRDKLEEKTFEKGMLYFNIMDYRAAATTLRSLLSDFPDTEYRERALFNIVRAHYEYAQLSIPARQAERYAEVTPAFEMLMNQFPESEYLPEAARMSETALSQIEKLKSTEEITENN